MTRVWVDANILLRFITRDVPAQNSRVRSLMQRAADGDILLRIPSVVVAEVVWVLASAYKLDRRTIAGTLRELAIADGIEIEEQDVVLDALRLMESANVAYVDAYLAAKARRHGEPVLTFDSDFRRLDVELFA
ncbi:MAG: PIN domain-containing protein [Chloroflexota bacterium]